MVRTNAKDRPLWMWRHGQNDDRVNAQQKLLLPTVRLHPSKSHRQPVAHVGLINPLEHYGRAPKEDQCDALHIEHVRNAGVGARIKNA